MKRTPEELSRLIDHLQAKLSAVEQELHLKRSEGANAWNTIFAGSLVIEEVELAKQVDQISLEIKVLRRLIAIPNYANQLTAQKEKQQQLIKLINETITPQSDSQTRALAQTALKQEQKLLAEIEAEEAIINGL